MVTARELSSGFGAHPRAAVPVRRPLIQRLLVRRLLVTGAELDALSARLNYWRNIRRVTVMLLVVWLVVTLALPWYVTELNLLRIGRFPLGFWLTSQGAVGIYVVLIVAYIWAVEMIEDAWHDADDAAADVAADVQGCTDMSAAATTRERACD